MIDINTIKNRILSKKKIIFSTLGLVVMVGALVVGVFVVQQVMRLRSKASNNNATLMLVPSSMTVSPGGSLKVSVLLDPTPGNYKVTATSVVITYPADKLTLNNVTPGQFFLRNFTSGSTEMLNKIDRNVAGTAKIVLGAPCTVAAPWKCYPSTGGGAAAPLASLDFVVKTGASGTVSIGFDQANTSVAALNSSGNAILTSVIDPTALTGVNIQISSNDNTRKGTLTFSPSSATKSVGQIFPVQVKINTAGQAISSVAMRVSYPFTGTGTSPELEVVDANGSVSNQIYPDATLVSSGDWSFPVKSVTRTTGNVTIDLAAVNSSTTGFSASTDTNLATIYFKVNRVLANPVTLTFDMGETKMLTKSTPSIDTLITPTNPSYTLTNVSPTANFKVKFQGMQMAAGMARTVNLIFKDGSVSKSYIVSTTSDASGNFSPSQPVALAGLPIADAGTNYDIFVKEDTHLKKKIGRMLILPAANNLTASLAVELKAGDVNGDNVINISDVSGLLSQYTALSVPVTDANRKYDLDGNGVINISDVSLMLSNYTALSVPGDE